MDGLLHLQVVVLGRLDRGLLTSRGVKERERVEAGIGTLKTPRYGFTRPATRSREKMGACGQRAGLGVTLNTRVRDLAKRTEVAVVG